MCRSSDSTLLLVLAKKGAEAASAVSFRMLLLAARQYTDLAQSTKLFLRVNYNLPIPTGIWRY
jgi:hypothetical protein